MKDVVDDSSEEDSSDAPSERPTAMPVGVSQLQAVRVGTSLTSSHFHGCTSRNKLTGKIFMNEDRYLPNFNLVDLFGRRLIVMTPQEMLKDQYLFRFEAMPTRTWIFHAIVRDPAAMTNMQIDDSQSSMIGKVLGEKVVDIPVATGERSPLLFWMPIIFLMGMTGDQNLVSFSLVSTMLIYAVTHTFNTPKKFTEVRKRLLPLRLASVGFFAWRFLAFPENQEYMPMVCILLSIVIIALDFFTGDMRVLKNVRFLASYSIIAELPNRIYLCKRHGAAHFQDVVGEREKIADAVIGKGFKSTMALIADLNGLLVELRRPTLKEAQMMHEEYQESCTDHGFLSLRTYTRERPCFAALDPSLTDEDLEKIVEKNQKDHPLTWRSSHPEDDPSHEKKVVDESDEDE